MLDVAVVCSWKCRGCAWILSTPNPNSLSSSLCPLSDSTRRQSYFKLWLKVPSPVEPHSQSTINRSQCAPDPFLERQERDTILRRQALTLQPPHPQQTKRGDFRLGLDYLHPCWQQAWGRWPWRWWCGPCWDRRLRQSLEQQSWTRQSWTWWVFFLTSSSDEVDWLMDGSEVGRTGVQGSTCADHLSLWCIGGIVERGSVDRQSTMGCWEYLEESWREDSQGGTSTSLLWTSGIEQQWIHRYATLFRYPRNRTTGPSHLIPVPFKLLISTIIFFEEAIRVFHEAGRTSWTPYWSGCL